MDDLDGTFTYLVSTKDGLGYAKDQWSAKPLVTMETDEVVAIASEGSFSAERLLRGDREAGAPGAGVHDLVTLDASTLTARELNRKLKELARNGAEITVVNPEAQHNIGVGIVQPCKINIKGSVGYFAASMSDGAEVTIDGNAGWALGRT